MSDLYSVDQKRTPPPVPASHVSHRPPRRGLSVTQLVALAGGIVLLIVVLTAVLAVCKGCGDRRSVPEEKNTNSPVVGMDVLPLH